MHTYFFYMSVISFPIGFILHINLFLTLLLNFSSSFFSRYFDCMVHSLKGRHTSLRGRHHYNMRHIPLPISRPIWVTKTRSFLRYTHHDNGNLVRLRVHYGETRSRRLTQTHVCSELHRLRQRSHSTGDRNNRRHHYAA